MKMQEATGRNELLYASPGVARLVPFYSGFTGDSGGPSVLYHPNYISLWIDAEIPLLEKF